ncbi:MAG: Bifunctional PGK [Lentisphaerae bacterium ADurb.BinA184]|nr:MAG: Bifunctional PGK [Lentisphaerae bacterium ADurb.BinA184]
MKRRPCIAGNWKMYKTVAEATALVNDLKPLVADVRTVDIVVCPPFTDLAAVVKATAGSNIAVGAQNVHWAASGAFTGEVSAAMLREIPVAYAIIGHSERRQYFAETDQTVNDRLKAALAAGLTAIVCVGETLDQRTQGATETVVGTQLDGGLAGLAAADMAKVIIAYEPVWAIGTGVTATPAQAQDVHAFIRRRLAARFGEGVAAATRIQYGGSVKPDKAAELLRQPDIDGALVGGASLKAADFAAIVKAGV